LKIASTPRESWILTTTILGSSMAFVDGTVVNVALPTLQRELGASLAGVQWVVEAYILFLTALLLTGGALGDRFGRRRSFALGVALFAGASLACGLAPTVNWLIVARAAQGIGGALLIPGSLALLSASFPAERRGRAIGIWSSFSAITTGLGLVLGGWLIDTAGWRWIFFINLPVAVLTLVLCFRVVPAHRPDHIGPLDLSGALIATLSLGGLVFGLIEISRLGITHPAVLGALLVGALGAVGFWRWERRCPHPMVPPDLFRQSRFAAANLLTLFLYAALGAMFFFVPMNLIQVHGYSSFAAGAASTPFIVLIFLLSRHSGALADRLGARPLLMIGPLLGSLGYGWLALGADWGYWPGFFPGIVVLGLGMAGSIAPLTSTVMGAVSEARSGVAAGINNAVSRGAGLLSVACLGPVIFLVFSLSLEARLRAAGVETAVIEAFRPAWIDLGAARPPEGLPAPLTASLTAMVRAAFVDGFRVVMGILAGLALLAAGVAYRGLGPARG